MSIEFLSHKYLHKNSSLYYRGCSELITEMKKKCLILYGSSTLGDGMDNLELKWLLWSQGMHRGICIAGKSEKNQVFSENVIFSKYFQNIYAAIARTSITARWKLFAF